MLWIEGEQFSLGEFTLGSGESLWLEKALWTHQRQEPVNVLVTWKEQEKGPTRAGPSGIAIACKSVFENACGQTSEV